MNELVRVEIESFGNENVVSSRVIAEGLSKRHADIIKQIEKILPNENVRSGISISNYVDSNNQLRKQYLLTKDEIHNLLEKAGVYATEDMEV